MSDVHVMTEVGGGRRGGGVGDNGEGGVMERVGGNGEGGGTGEGGGNG